MNLRSRLFSLLTAFFLLSTPVFAQQTEPPPPTTPTFTSRSELVLIPVVVKDRKGQHLPGLTKSDFEVREDGRPRKIDLFEEVKTLGTIGQDRRTTGDFSNFKSQDERPRRLIIIVLDLLNTPFLHQVRAKQELLSFLEKSVPGDEPMALLTLSGNGLHQIHPFTTDPRVLIAALKRVRGNISNLEASAGLPDEDRADLLAETDDLTQFQSKAETADFSGFRTRENIHDTMTAMEQIAHAYAGVPGRKGLVWATSGFPFLLDDPRSAVGFSTEMYGRYERAWKALNQANIAVYPIDARGLTNSVYDQQFSPSRQGPGRNMNRGRGFDNYEQTRATLQNFAGATGGIACIDRNDLANCFRKAADDSEAYYLIGYYLGSEPRKPGWHKLKVELNRDHGQLRARSGFLSTDPKQVQQADLKMELGTALAAPMDYTGVHLDLSWQPITPVTDPNAKRQAGFLITANAASLMIDTARENYINLEIAALIRDANGKYVSEYSREITAKLKPESVEKIRRGGMTYRGKLELDPGQYNVRFVLRDNLNGNLGTLTAPLTVK